MTRPITKPQVRAIRARQHVIGMDDPTYRELLDREFGVASTLDLTLSQGNHLMHKLYGGPVRQNKKPARRQPIQNPAPTQKVERDYGGVVRLASPLQQRMIRALVGEVTWETDEGYRRWLQRSLGLQQVRTTAEAQRVIEGLKGLKAHGHRARVQT